MATAGSNAKMDKPLPSNWKQVLVLRMGIVIIVLFSNAYAPLPRIRLPSLDEPAGSFGYILGNRYYRNMNKMQGFQELERGPAGSNRGHICMVARFNEPVFTRKMGANFRRSSPYFKNCVRPESYRYIRKYVFSPYLSAARGTERDYRTP